MQSVMIVAACVLCQVGVCVQPAAPAATPQPAMPAQEERITLTPVFRVGDVVRYHQTSYNPRRSPLKPVAPITMTVLAVDDKSVELKWEMGPIEQTPDMPPGAADQANAMTGNVPPMLLMFDRATGAISLKDWQKARDEYVELSLRTVAKLSKRDEATTARARAALENMTSSRQGTEQLLLKQHRGFFLAFGHSGVLGKEEKLNRTISAGKDLPDFPCEDTWRLDRGQPDSIIVCRCRRTIDRNSFREFLQAFIKARFPEIAEKEAGMKMDEYLKLVESAQFEVETKFDMAKGWPVSVRYTLKSGIASTPISEEYQWSLVGIDHTTK